MNFEFNKSFSLAGGDITIGVIDISPEMAKAILDQSNIHNRKLKNKQVDCYVSLMERDKWRELTVIKITKEGWLSDGQHRLTAAVKANYTLRNVILITGVDVEDQMVTDRGSKRTFADDLALRGYKNSKTLAAITGRAKELDRGVKLQYIISSSNTNRSEIEAATDLMDFFGDNEEEMVHLCDKVITHRKSSIPSAVLNIAVIVFYRIDEVAADRFFQKLETCVFDSESDPLNRLHARIINSKQSNQNKTPHRTMLAYVIKAWNAFIRGENVSQLKWTSEGKFAEAFPVPISPQEVS